MYRPQDIETGDSLMHNALRLLDLALPTPGENLACDEALFVECEQRGGNGTLRFWEPSRSFVVVGYANAVGREVQVDDCRALGIPIVRRCTGGGTVVQMSGCLNYALVLPLDRHEEFKTIASTNRMIMETLRTAIAALNRSASLTIEGISDLALDGKKFSGNAQRRGEHFLLFHGVILYRADLQLITRLLPMPSRQPKFRQNRPHKSFLTNIDCSADDLKRGITEAWGAIPYPDEPPWEEIRRLTRSKYTQESWNFKR